MSERRTLQESLEQLNADCAELKGLVLAEVAAHFWGLLTFCRLVIGGMVLVGIARPEWVM